LGLLPRQIWGLREFAVTDPDGYNLCFCTPSTDRNLSEVNE